MGYSISQRTHELLQKRNKEGRLCMMDRPHIARAIWRVITKSWYYTEDRLAGKPHRDSVGIYCNRCFERYVKPWMGVEDERIQNCVFVSAERF